MVDIQEYVSRLEKVRIDRSAYDAIITEIASLGEAAIPDIIEAIYHGKSIYGLIDALGHMGNITTMHLMALFLDDKLSDGVRAQISGWLRQFADARLVYPLLTLIIEQDSRRTRRAIFILVSTNDPAIDTTMKELLFAIDSSDNQRASAIDLLSQRGVTSVLETIRQYVEHETLGTIANIALYRLDSEFDIAPIKVIYRNPQTDFSERLAIENEIRRKRDYRFVPFAIEILEDYLEKDANNTLNEDKDFNIRYALVRILEFLKDERAIDTLVKCMNRQGFAPEWSMMALAAIGTYQTKQVLIDKLGRGFSWFEPVGAIKTLHTVVTSFGDEVVPDLINIATNRDEDFFRRVAATSVLCDIGGDQVVELFLTMLDDPKHVGVICESSVSSKIGKLQDKRFLQPWLRELRTTKLHSQHGAHGLATFASTEELISLLFDDSTFVRQAAVIALGMKTDVQAVEPLISLLPQKQHNYWIVQSLAKIGDPSATEALVGQIGIAHRAGYYAVEVGGFKALEPLIKRLKDKNSNIRQEAARALLKITDTRAVEPIYKAYSKMKDKSVKNSLLYALANLGDERAIPELLTVLDSEPTYQTPDPVEGTAKILGEKFPNQQVVTDALRDRLLAFEHDNTQLVSISGTLIYQLQQRGEPGIKALIDVLQSQNPIIKYRTLEAIYQAANRRQSIKLLIPYLDDTTLIPNLTVERRECQICDYVAYMMKDEAIPRVQEIYQEWKESEDNILY